MRQMPIVWKRLVVGAGTCGRCGNTRHELDLAVAKLAASLLPLGIEPILELQELNEAEFKANPSESNRIWIAGKPVEEWLGASVGMSRCCSVCGDSDCRTLEIEGRSYEAIPEDQLVKAGLIAASQMIAPVMSTVGSTSPSCGDIKAVSTAIDQRTSKGNCCR